MSRFPDGTTLGRAGSAASGNIDISRSSRTALPVYLAVVVGLSFVIMVLVFRSMLVPLTATLGFVMSLFAAFGGSRGDLPVGLASEDVSTPARPDPQLPADAAGRDPLRAGDGLPAVPVSGMR
jgi:uncharacterized membrane protein YdfJ with MMPL/SSD domain